MFICKESGPADDRYTLRYPPLQGLIDLQGRQFTQLDCQSLGP